MLGFRFTLWLQITQGCFLGYRCGTTPTTEVEDTISFARLGIGLHRIKSYSKAAWEKSCRPTHFNLMLHCLHFSRRSASSIVSWDWARCHASKHFLRLEMISHTWQPYTQSSCCLLLPPYYWLIVPCASQFILKLQPIIYPTHPVTTCISWSVP